MTAVPLPQHSPHLADDPSCPQCVLAMRIWAERDQLLRIARRRTSSDEDAADVVGEAMTRALERPYLDPDLVAGWLTRVTLNLCADLGRDRSRAAKRARFTVMHQHEGAPVDELVSHRVDAQRISKILEHLPEAQRNAMLLRAEGRSVAEVAEAMQLSTKAAESLLSRARSSLRSVVASGVVAVAVMIRTLRRSALPAVSVGALAVAALTPALWPVRTPSQANGATTLHSTKAIVVARAADRREPTTQPVNARSREHLSSSSTPHPTATNSDRLPKELVPDRELQAGPAHAHDKGAGRTHTDESVQESVQRCLEQGVAVSTTYIGCRSAGSD